MYKGLYTQAQLCGLMQCFANNPTDDVTHTEVQHIYAPKTVPLKSLTAYSCKCTDMENFNQLAPCAQHRQTDNPTANHGLSLPPPPPAWITVTVSPAWISYGIPCFAQFLYPCLDHSYNIPCLDQLWYPLFGSVSVSLPGSQLQYPLSGSVMVSPVWISFCIPCLDHSYCVPCLDHFLGFPVWITVSVSPAWITDTISPVWISYGIPCLDRSYCIPCLDHHYCIPCLAQFPYPLPGSVTVSPA